MDLAEGAVFAGYTIVRPLGRGGMGEVYLARHPRLPRQEALKILSASVSADAEYQQRFVREADIAASLWHPHIVAVHDRGEFEGQLWIAMDYVEGTDAARLLRDRYPRGLPPHAVTEIVSAIAEALDHAHQRRLLHRDVKPANILLTEPDSGPRRIMLADFGIAKAANESNNLTATNMAVGTVAYAAPEQLTGDPIDGRADQYALACTAFQLLCGQQPYASSNPVVVIGHHLSSPPPRLASLRPDLAPFDAVLARAMAKDRDQRYGSCREFAAALAAAQTTTAAAAAHTLLAAGPPPAPVSAPPAYPPQSYAPPPAAAPPSSGMRPAVLVAAAAVALLAVGVVAFMGTKLAQTNSDSSASTVRQTATHTITDRRTSEPEQTRTTTATPTRTPTSTRPAKPYGDLGLSTPMSQPACDGQGIVILGSVTTPGQYAQGVQRLLNANPGASYLRTDQTCPSLRATDDSGNAIYAVYRPGGRTEGQLCSAVRSAGGDAYGKWLDTTTDPNFYLTC